MTDDPRLPRRATKSKYKPGSAPLKKNPSKIIDKGEREPRCPYCEKRFADQHFNMMSCRCSPCCCLPGAGVLWGRIRR